MPLLKALQEKLDAWTNIYIYIYVYGRFGFPEGARDSGSKVWAYYGLLGGELLVRWWGEKKQIISAVGWGRSRGVGLRP